MNVTPVKGLGLEHPDGVLLDERGAEGDRRFHLVDADGRLLNGKHHGPLVRVRAHWEDPVLTLTFPDGTAVSEEIGLGAPVATQFYTLRSVAGRLVDGPFADALSEYVGRGVRLVAVGEGELAVDACPATLVSAATVERVGVADARRYRILLELDGCAAFEEDTWEGGLVRAGEALLRVGGPVTRCAVTTQSPETGVREVDTLRRLVQVRGAATCGVYAEVVEPGRVRLGDPVTPAAY